MERIAAELGDAADAVAAVFPELAGDLGEGGRAALGPDDFSEVRAVRALSALLDALGSPQRPALVVLDDCQWADELSTRLLTRWDEDRRRPCHVLVVVAYRSEELGMESAIRRLAAHQRIALAPLESGDVEALATSMAGVVPDEALQTTARLSEGSPFMAAAVLRGLVESGALVSGPDGWEVDAAALATVRSSSRAATVLAHRISLLNEETRRLLAVGAVLGKEFEVSVAAALAGVEPVDVGRAVREASRRHLTWSMDGGGRCLFVHDKIRETLLQLIDGEERRRLHEQTATLLEDALPRRGSSISPTTSMPPATLTAPCPTPLPLPRKRARSRRWPWWRSSTASPSAERSMRRPTRRRRIAEELGRVLMLRGQYEEAAERLEAARSFAADPATLARIDGLLGELAFKRGDMNGSAEALERAVRSLGQRMPARVWLPFVVWEVLVQAVHSLLPAVVCGRRSIDDPGRDADLLAAHLYSRLAHTYWFQRGSVATLFAHLRGMNLTERYPPTAERAQAYSEHAPVMSLLPWFSRGIDYATRSHAIRRDLGDIHGQGRSLHFHGVVLYGASRWEECQERCREAVRLLDRTGDRWEVNTARWHIAYAAYRSGRPGDGRLGGQQVWRDGIDLGDPQARQIGLAVWSKATDGRIPAEAVAAEVAAAVRRRPRRRRGPDRRGDPMPGRGPTG